MYQDLAPADATQLLTSTREVVYHLPPQDTRRERGGYAATAATPADLRLVMDAIAARTQRLIEGCWRVRMWSFFLVLSVAGKFGSRIGKLP
jgi:hypothetical protein